MLESTMPERATVVKATVERATVEKVPVDRAAFARATAEGTTVVRVPSARGAVAVSHRAEPLAPPALPRVQICGSQAAVQAHGPQASPWVPSGRVRNRRDRQRAVRAGVHGAEPRPAREARGRRPEPKPVSPTVLAPWTRSFAATSLGPLPFAAATGPAPFGAPEPSGPQRCGPGSGAVESP
ncbi:hypothetical protein [Glycomyces paridis]|uniref:Uncharacterized protein n=1 Tax=Glycomyces paridis TaxID=2126555 RepID=A0A4S8PAG4_9ACTN|nr:hypothetical protein [Glycomyces paridis]THV26711.1 hypothetical protein E9998_17100 [Glycomyces paridis]